MSTPRPRWEGDEAGAGIADGSALAPTIWRLVEAMAEPGWVTEQPEEHLLPQLRHGCSAPGSPWALLGAGLVGSVYVVQLDWRPAAPSFARLRGEVFMLLGMIAEQATHVTQRTERDHVEYEVATGMLEGGSPFAPHGHLLRLVITGDAARTIAERATSDLEAGESS